MDETRTLHLVDDADLRAAPPADPGAAREAYWAQVQALRADLARLRPVS